MSASVSLWAAFSAGVLSFFSPCVLPLVPVYFAYIIGLGSDENVSDKPVLVRLGKTSLFVAGFSLVFVLMGALAGFFGFYLFRSMPWLIQASGIVIAAFGVVMILGALDIKIPSFISRQRKLNIMNGVRKYPLLMKIFPFVFGISFGFAWTPCIGPVLGGILTLAFSSRTAGQGTALLAVYSAGIGIPFLLSSVFIGKLEFITRGRKKMFRAVQLLSGAILIFFGILVLTGEMVKIITWFLNIIPFYHPW